MLSIHQLQIRAESLPLLKHGLRLLHVTWLFLSNILGLALNFILLFGLKLISLPVFQVEAPEIDPHRDDVPGRWARIGG